MEHLAPPSPPALSSAALPWWRRWQATLLAAFLLVTLAAGAVEIADVFRAYRRAEEAALLNQTETALTLARATEIFADRYIAVARAADKVLEAGLADDARRRVLGRIKRAHSEITAVTIADRTGRIVDADPADAIGLDLSDRPYYRQVVAGASVVVGDLMVGKQSGSMVIPVAAAARGPDGALRGMVVLGLSVDALARDLAVRLTSGAYPLVVDRAGRVVVHGGRADLDWASRDFSGVPLVADALAGRPARSSRFRDPLTGEPMLGAMVPLLRLGWAIGAIQPLGTALAPAREQLQFALATAAVVLGLGAALALVLSVWLSSPIDALAAGVAAVARGDLGHRITRLGPRNELGLLADSFNAMASRLEATLADLETAERRYRELVEGLEAIVWEADATTRRFSFVSRRAEAILGYPVERWLAERDFWLALVHPEDRGRIAALGRSAVRDRNDLDVEFRAVAADGRVVWLRNIVYVAPDAGSRPETLRGLMVDVTARKQAEEALAARARQQAVVADLGRQALAEVDLAALRDEAATAVTRTLEVEYCEVLELLPDGRALLVRAGAGWKPGTVGRATAGAGRDSQAGYTLLSGEPVIVEDLRRETRFTGSPLVRDHGVVSGLSVVIRGRDRPYGVLGAHTTRRRTFTRDDVYFLRAVANVLATAIQRQQAEAERSDLLARERAARAEAEAAQRRATFLAEASRVLASSLDHEATLADVARLAVPDLADWCVIDVVGGDGRLERLAVVHRDPSRVELARELDRRYPPDPDAPAGPPNVVRTGRPELVPEVPDSLLVAVARDAEHLRILRELRFTSYMCVPLSARGRMLGGLTFVLAESGRRYGPVDLTLAEELAGRVALAVDNARLFREAQEAIRAREAFLARASHELRTPLTSALGTIRLLQRAREDWKAESREALLAVASRNLGAMAVLINDLLDASKLASGRVTLALEPVEVAALVSETFELVSGEAREKHVALRAAVPAGLTLRADRVKLGQVLVNLLGNAVKFTPAGGEVIVEAEAEGGHALIRVRDTGEGIAREHLEQIFEPFFQASAAAPRPAVDRRVERARGTGLGLAICRQIVTLHGGRVWAESEGPGRGSTFTIRIPLGSAEGQAA